MSIEVIFILMIILVALGLFATEVIPVEVTAISVMVTLMIFGFVSPQEGLSGFSNVATATILALLILSEGLRQTGAVKIFADKLIPFVGNNKSVALLSVMISTAVLSAFINNTAVVAIFIPVVLRLSAHMKVSASLLLIPLSFSAMAGGSATLIGSSTNLLVNNVAISNGGEGFSMFSFSIIGSVLVVIVILFILLFGKKLIPKRKPESSTMTDDFKTEGFITEVVIDDDSPLIGKALQDTFFHKSEQMDIIGIVRNEDKRWLPAEVEKLKTGDIIVVKADRKKLTEFITGQGLSIRTLDPVEDQQLTDQGGALVELLIGPSANITGTALKESDFKSRFNAIPLALRKRKERGFPKFVSHRLEFGDVILVETKQENIEHFKQNPEWIVLNVSSKENRDKMTQSRTKAAIASGIMIAVVLIAAFNVLPIVVAAWAGCATMFLTGCLIPKKTYQNVQWSVFFLLAGIIPLGIAMENTGTSKLLAESLVTLVGDWGIHGVIAIVFGVTVLLTSIMSNNATAILLAPIAIQLGQSLDIPIEALLITVLLGANSSFLTPVGYQTNTMVYNPGNYRFMDFVKVGGLLSLIFLIAVVALIPVLYM